MVWKSLVAATAALALAACSGSVVDDIPKRDPAQGLSFGDHRMRADDDLAMNADDQPMWVQSLVSGYQAAREEPPAASVIKIKPYGECVFPRVREDERFSHVHVTLDNNEAKLYAIPAAFMRERAADMVKIAAGGGNPDARYKPPSNKDLHFKVANVIITDASKPHYLVLTGQGNVIFNFVLGKGVTLSEVVILSEDSAGYANLPDDVPVAVLAASGARRCKLKVQMRQDRDAPVWKRLKEKDDALFTRRLSLASRDAFEFRRWFDKAFDRDAYVGVTRVERLANVLIGPAPARLKNRLPYKGIGDTDIRFVSGDTVFQASEREYGIKFADMLRVHYQMLSGKVSGS